MLILQSNCQTSPVMMNVGIKNAVSNRTEFHECLTIEEAVYRVDVIVTTGHDISSLSLRKKVLAYFFSGQMSLFICLIFP